MLISYFSCDGFIISITNDTTTNIPLHSIYVFGTIMSYLHIITHLIPKTAIVLGQWTAGARVVTPNQKAKGCKEQLFKHLNYHCY